MYKNGSGPERLLEFGSTCTCAVVQGRSVWMANVGDSTAVLGTDNGGALHDADMSGKLHCRHMGLHELRCLTVPAGASYTSKTLTVRHNGHNAEEAKRMKVCASMCHYRGGSSNAPAPPA